MAQTLKNYRVSASALIDYNGETRTLVDWCKYLDLNYHVVRMRYRRGKVGNELFHATPTGFYAQVRPTSSVSAKFPSIYYTLDHDTKVKLMRSCNGEYEAMQRTIELAIREYVKDY